MPVRVAFFKRLGNEINGLVHACGGCAFGNFIRSRPASSTKRAALHQVSSLTGMPRFTGLLYGLVLNIGQVYYAFDIVHSR